LLFLDIFGMVRIPLSVNLPIFILNLIVGLVDYFDILLYNPPEISILL